MATVTNYGIFTSDEGHKVVIAGVTGTSAYVHETGDYIQYGSVTGANSIIMVCPCGVSNGGYVAGWQNATNTLHYYGSSNIAAVGATTHNGQPLLAVGNAVNLATHVFPVLIVMKGS